MGRAFSSGRGGSGDMLTVTFAMTVPASPLTDPATREALIGGLLHERIELAAQYLAGVVAQVAPVNFGHLAQSFGAQPATAEGGIEISAPSTDGVIQGRVFSSLPQAIVMDEGRRPGARMPPVAALALWAQRKLGVSADEADAVGYVLARSIARRGIEGRHYADAAVARAQGHIEALFAVLEQELARQLGGAA